VFPLQAGEGVRRSKWEEGRREGSRRRTLSPDLRPRPLPTELGRKMITSTWGIGGNVCRDSCSPCEVWTLCGDEGGLLNGFDSSPAMLRFYPHFARCHHLAESAPHPTPALGAATALPRIWGGAY